MSQLISIPVIFLLLSLQMTVTSKFMILNGFADLMIVWLSAWVVLTKIKNSWIWFLLGAVSISFVSAVPWYANVLGYLVIFIIGLTIKKRLWQSPLLSFFLVLISGSVIYYLVILFSIRFTGTIIVFMDAISKIALPSLILNLIVAIPLYLLARDMTIWLYPQEE
jgi:hypothetical protein